MRNNLFGHTTLLLIWNNIEHLKSEACLRASAYLAHQNHIPLAEIFDECSRSPSLFGYSMNRDTHLKIPCKYRTTKMSPGGEPIRITENGIPDFKRFIPLEINAT